MCNFRCLNGNGLILGFLYPRKINNCGLTVYTEATKLIFKVVLFNKLNIKHKADTNMFFFGSSHVHDVL